MDPLLSVTFQYICDKSYDDKVKFEDSVGVLLSILPTLRGMILTQLSHKVCLQGNILGICLPGLQVSVVDPV